MHLTYGSVAMATIAHVTEYSYMYSYQDNVTVKLFSDKLSRQMINNVNNYKQEHLKQGHKHNIIQL